MTTATSKIYDGLPERNPAIARWYGKEAWRMMSLSNLDKLQLTMSDKEAVLELVKRLPASVSLGEILREIEFIAAVKEGLDEIDQGQGISVESVEQMMAAWTTP